MRKPADEKLEEFWIDFNLGSRSVTFYIDSRESALWEPVQLSKEAVVKFSAVEHAEESTILPGFVGDDDDLVDDDDDDRCLITRSFDVQSEPAQTDTEDSSHEKSKPQDPKQEVTSKHKYPSDMQEPSTQTQASKLNDTKKDSAFEGDAEQDRRRPAKLTPVWKRISGRSDTTLPKFSDVKLQELRSLHPLGSLSPLEHPEFEENVPQIGNRETFMENISFKHKLENSEHTGDISTSSQEDVPENANSSAFKTAFENFTRDLKRKFELKQKEIPLSSEKAKEVPGCLIRFWNQIHTCRLNKLERFHRSVLQELSDMEKDLQALNHLEEDALASPLFVLSLGTKRTFSRGKKRSNECLVEIVVPFQEFWEKGSADLRSLCDQQTLRDQGSLSAGPSCGPNMTFS
ncbi:synaptonemal complex protein 2 [Cricetulus griseus]|uniref:Synaptonemal complex protein 2 n=1 Tax=Cricetulus griseus TaxID=10029 RepID=A0A061I8U8_CRIGR|nr:synaptonemal complex protein 2 [Cricetulus griseus]